MKTPTTYVKIDSRHRVSLKKIAKNLVPIYKAYTKGNTIILEPVQEIPEEEAWLFEPENKKVLERIKESLSQEATIDLGSFKKYASKK